MSKYTLSRWISSSGGPLIVMREAKAGLWSGIDGSPSDYDIACQFSDYTSKLVIHDSEVLVLGDEPLQTAIAIRENVQLLVRWKWADNEADIRAEIDKLNLDIIHPVEILNIDWSLDQHLVVFDAADVFGSSEYLKFMAQSGINTISTFVYEPSTRTSLLIHAITRKCAGA